MRNLPLLLILVLPLLGCASRLSPRPDGPPPEERLRALERQVLELVNTYRVHQGLRPLVAHPHLSEVARMHSRAMAAGDAPFSHAGLQERLHQVSRRVPVVDIGENLYADQPASGLAGWWAVTGWLGSEPHRESIEERCYDLTGIGVALSESGRIFFTQLFARRLPSSSVWRAGSRLQDVTESSRGASWGRADAFPAFPDEMP